MASRVLTISIANDFTRICDISNTKQGKIQVNKAISVPTPAMACEDGMITNIPLMAKTLKDTLEEYGLMTKNVVFCIHSSRIASKEIITPDLKEKKFLGYINTNATEYFPVNIDEYVLSGRIIEHTVENGVKSLRAIVAIAPLNMVEAYYDMAELLELHVDAVDYLGNATLQYIRKEVSLVPNIVVQISDESTVLTIINRGVLQMMRTVPYGKATIANALMERDSMTYDEAIIALTDNKYAVKSTFRTEDEVTASLKYLVNNIARVMDYYTGKNPTAPIEKLYLMVEGTPVHGVHKLLANELGIQVEKLDPNVGSTLIQTLEEVDLSLYIPTIGASINPIGFISNNAKEKAKKEAVNKYYRLSVLVAILIAVVVVVIPLMKFASKNSEKKDLKKSITSLEGVRITADRYYLLQDKINDADKFKAMAKSNNDDLGKFIDFLEKNMPSDISVESFNVANGAATMSFSASSKLSCAQFLLTLKNNPAVTEVFEPTVSETMDALGNKTVTSSVTFIISLVEETEETETKEAE